MPVFVARHFRISIVSQPYLSRWRNETYECKHANSLTLWQKRSNPSIDDETQVEVFCCLCSFEKNQEE